MKIKLNIKNKLCDTINKNLILSRLFFNFLQINIPNNNKKIINYKNQYLNKNFKSKISMCALLHYETFFILL